MLFRSAGDVLTRIVTFAAMGLVWKFIVVKRIRYITDSVNAASNEMTAGIREKRYTVERTTCNDVKTKHYRGENSVSSYFFVLEGYSHDVKYEAPCERVTTGDTVDVIEYDNRVFVIKAL